MRDIINKFKGGVKRMYNEKNYKFLIENHIRLVEIFENKSLNEGNEELRNIVVQKIQNGEWEEQNPESFYNALNKSKHKEMLTDYTVSELANMKLFKLAGYDVGYALKRMDNGKYSEIVAVFNNEPNVRGIGKELMQSAIDNGGCYLDHYDGFLSNLYQSMGFDEYERYEFDPQYDPEGKFKDKYGEADVIFRKHRSCK